MRNKSPSGSVCLIDDAEASRRGSNRCRGNRATVGETTQQPGKQATSRVKAGAIFRFGKAADGKAEKNKATGATGLGSACACPPSIALTEPVMKLTRCVACCGREGTHRSWTPFRTRSTQIPIGTKAISLGSGSLSRGASSAPGTCHQFVSSVHSPSPVLRGRWGVAQNEKECTLFRFIQFHGEFTMRGLGRGSGKSTKEVHAE